MARSAIPEFYKNQPNGEPWPEYEYQPFPRYVGLDAEGNALTAQSEKEYEEMKPLAVYPQSMGKDKHGKDVIAQNPRDLVFFKDRVVTPPESPEEIAKREAAAREAEEKRLAEEAETKRKAEAYDALMAQQKQATDAPAPGEAAPAETAPTGLKKSKAA